MYYYDQFPDDIKLNIAILLVFNIFITSSIDLIITQISSRSSMFTEGFRLYVLQIQVYIRDKGQDDFRDVHVDGRMILKMNDKERWCEVLNSTGSA